jgi:AraC family ethanolamine operon transcriptional activator
MQDPGQNYVSRTRLDDILELKRIARGVNMDITQLDAGPFESQVVQLKVGDLLVSRITSTRRLRLQGDVSFLTISLLTSDSGSPKWRGTPVNPNDIVAVQAGEAFDLVVPPDVESVCISAIGHAEVMLRNVGGPVLVKTLSDTSMPIPCDPDAMRKIRGLFLDRLADLEKQMSIPAWQAEELERAFLRALAYCLRGGTPSAPARPPASRRLDAVQRVEDHLLHDLTIPQTISALCTVAGTSRRTLEYAFREYFGTSPRQFIKALKLNAARGDLLRANHESARVVEIASTWGFSHMGQFAADYRRMFGEAPSETLRRSHPAVSA